jgi:hypothetical protein
MLSAMSWDVFIMAFPPEIQDLGQVADDWEPPSLGTGEHVRNILSEVLPGIVYSAGGFGDYDGPGFSLSTPVNEADEDQVTCISLFIHGGGPEAANAALAIAEALNARAFGTGTGKFLSSESAESDLAAWRSYRDRVLGPHDSAMCCSTGSTEGQRHLDRARRSRCRAMCRS